MDYENELLNIISGYRKAQLLYVAAKLGISDLLVKGPKSSDEISQCTDTNPNALYRVMRALSSFGIYKENENKSFELTAKGELLKKNAPGSVRINAIMRMEEYNWKPWGELLYSVKTGKSAFKKIFGINLFEYLRKNFEASQIFSEAMGVYTRSQIKAVLDNYDFSSFRTIADIGGSSGDLLKLILVKYPHLQGLLFDLSAVIQNLDSGQLNSEFKGRLKIESGDFFDFIPQNCDLYIFKKIIHDWDDEHSVKILKNCCDAAGIGAKVLLIESIIDDKNQNSSDAVINDIHMLVQTVGGRERTKTEYFNLLRSAGFEPVKSSINFIEGIKRKI